MTTRILAVTDLSSEADVALIEGHRRARDAGGTLGVVHAIALAEASRPLFPQHLADDAVFLAELPVRAATAVQARLETLGLDQVPVELFVDRGGTAELALRIADEWKPALIVAGAGSIDSERLVRHAGIPVVIARPGPETGPVVAGTDLSDESLPAIRAGAAEAAHRGGELTVVHAVESVSIAVYGLEAPTAGGDLNRERREAAEARLREALAGAGVTGTAVVHDAAPADALIEIARTLEATLLVVGTHGRTGITRFLLGSVAEEVVRRAPCSVLVTRLA